ncbi:MAG: 3-keto-5-aminohexanoate cleavage protein [Azoarcus sp.]|jgi:uncharacterized protein (DUF849 family)|nr:3-keto-5-aminohexanoate cleavage protein [Azoarcus sp.]
MNKPNNTLETPMLIEAAICPYRGGEPVFDLQGMIREAKACLAAGATLIHHHHDGRLDTAGGMAEMIALSQAVHAEFPHAILNPNPAKGEDVRDNSAHFIPMFRAGALGLVPVDPGRQISPQLDDNGLPFGDNKVHSTFNDANYILTLCQQNDVPLTIGVYEPYNLRWALAYAEAGKLPAGSMVKLYFGGRYSLHTMGKRALNFGLPPTTQALDAYLSMLDGSGLQWSVTVMGDALLDTPLARHAIERGGHLRVGIEDMAGRSPASNRETVELAVELANKVGRPLARSDQAWTVLGRNRAPIAAAA